MHLAWVKTVHFEHAAQEATLLDYLHEVEHAADRIQRLERAIDDAVKTAPDRMRAVIEALQALRGIAVVSAVTIVAEVGELSRFTTARQLMGYSGAVSREKSTGERIRRGSITKTGNAHLRRIVIEAAWAYRHRLAVGAALRKRQATVPATVKEIALKAQHRLYFRHRHLAAHGKCQQQVVTALGRELLGFIWAIGREVETKGRNGGLPHRRLEGSPFRVPLDHHRYCLPYLALRGHWPYGAKSALLVRGSSRRITIMRFRPANIRVINRRDSFSATTDAAFQNGRKTS
jgi:hypothetical protein